MSTKSQPERWAPVRDFECLYSISSHGRIRRELSRTNGKAGHLLKPGATRGYLRADLSRPGRLERRMVARMVAEAFIGPCPSGLQVNHKDGNKLNNHVTNLEYVTPKQNIHHAHALGLRWALKGEQVGMAILTEKQVKRIRARYAVGGCSYASLGVEYGVVRETIGRIVRRLNWKHI